MPTSEQVEHDDSSRPNVGFLCISKDVCHLFGRLVQESATLGEVGYRIEAVLDCKTEIEKLDFCEIFVAAEDDVVGFYVTMDHILLFVQVRQCAEQSTHNLSALLLG